MLIIIFTFKPAPTAVQSHGGFEPVAPCKGNVSANRMQNLKTRFSGSSFSC
nr:MAG TPA: hypothetical protein [Caudoviricetes sp.]